MKKIILILIAILFTVPVLAADEKPGRFFEDQPDVNDDYQIHFNYLLAADTEDREWDINGKMQEILTEMNQVMAEETSKKDPTGISKKYKFDYRKDGKIDVTFIRLTLKHKELSKYANLNIVPYLWLKKMNNQKKIYYNFADFGNVDGGEAGVPVGTTYVKNKHNSSAKNKLITITLHELHHTQGGGFNCVPGMSGNSHYSNRDKKTQLAHGRALGATYIHKKLDCPQLVDSAYLTPTSKNSYDPYKLVCLNELGKYTNKKIVKALDKQKSKIEKGKWRGRGFGSFCSWRMSNNFDFLTNEIAEKRYREKSSN